MAKVIEMDHPLIKHKLTHLRNKNTQHPVFRQLITEITHLMLYEATRGLSTKTKQISTPLMACSSEVLDEEIVIIPILRAGLGMLDGYRNLLPIARIGFVGLYRDEETLEPVKYYLKSPEVKKARVLVLDPILATGGSVSKAIYELKEIGASEISFMCIVAAPEGIKQLQANHPDVDIFCAAIDDGLDENGYILPGIGDCGDRLFGTI